MKYVVTIYMYILNVSSLFWACHQAQGIKWSEGRIAGHFNDSPESVYPQLRQTQQHNHAFQYT